MKAASKPTVVVLSGGPNSEHDVSLISAKTVVEALKSAKFRVVQLKVGREKGDWAPAVSKLTDFATAQNKKKKRDLCVFPMIHGTYGEDGSLQGLLELLGLPYVGTRVLGSALGMDKAVQKQLLTDLQIPTTRFMVVTAAEWRTHKADVLARAAKLFKAFPVFVKPARSGSSVGVSKVDAQDALAKAIRDALLCDTKILVEEGIEKPREVECAVLGDGSDKSSQLLQISGFGEIRYESAFYDYDAKYNDPKTQLVIPAKLSATLVKQLKSYALRAANALEVHGYARVDFFIDAEGHPFLNEINTIPGFTSGSMFPLLWAHEGKPLAKVVAELVRMAMV